ncbi:hypothetical protein [Pseudoalteromonas aurantia]|nr:hypothetical protein [Pseudoalteromonas aurantia]
MKIKLIFLLIIAFIHNSSYAGRKLGLTELVIFDRGLGFYELSARHKLKPYPFPELLKFHVCGSGHFVEGKDNGETKFNIKKCDLKNHEIAVSLFHEKKGERVFYQKISPEKCRPNSLYNSIFRNYEGKVNIFLADFYINEPYVIKTESGVVLDRFKTVQGCTYYAEFEIPIEEKSIFINDKPYSIETL